jgi:outer membrane receptor protein involved in Fe transport
MSIALHTVAASLAQAVAGPDGRCRLLIGTAAVALAAGAAHAQTPAAATPATDTATTAAAPAEPAADDAATLVVTGTRIARDGFSAPTPVSVIGAAELRAEPQANIGDFVNTLPSVRGSQTSSNNSGSLSNGQAGIATVNLRALGSQRTLVLIDGQRSVASTTVGFVDTQTIPQGLIKGIEVVTGGASSVYGSDAVSGVVNFILNRDFEGLKADYEFGITDYGDVPNHTFRLTAGVPFAGGRGHILAAIDFFQQTGVDTYDRPWQDSGFFQIDNPAFVQGNGQPERLVQAGIGTHQFTPGGIVNTGPLRGTFFGNIDRTTGQASLNTFNYGPTRGQWMVGGDYRISREGHVSTNSLAPHEMRGNAFGRLSYEFSPLFNAFAQFSYSGYSGQSFYQQTPSVGVTIQRDNAFLPEAFRQRMVAANVTSVSIGTSNAGFPAAGSDNSREVFRTVVGGDGVFETGSIDWKWDAYYQVGIAKTNETLTNTWRNDRVALAQDAVRAPAGNAAGVAAGTIVCRSTLTNPGNGCVPLNRIGVGGVSQAAVLYTFNDGNQPQRLQSLRQDVAALHFSTNNLFSTWAGPVSLAFGGEYRRERVDGSVDPQFNSGWLYGNYLVTAGVFDVKEAFVETVIPLWEGLDFNGAFRQTDYSTSGSVSTWKLGATWQIIDDIKLRATRSRDIRAPNLAELFAPGTARTNTVNVLLPGGGQRADQFLEQTTGNTALTPEVAMTWGAGAVFTPTFLPGFAASIDYFDIDLQDAIGTITAQTITTLCLEQNRQDLCQFITFNGPAGPTSPITGIKLVPFNFARQRAKGFDIEASYRTDLGNGSLTLRGLVSHYIDNIVDNGIDVARDLAGQNAGGNEATPSWNYRLTANYDLERWSFNLVGRGFSGGVYDNNFVECTTTCPISTPQARTINTNRIAGQWYLDATLTHRFKVQSSDVEAFFYVRNLLNSDPVLVGNGPTGNNTPAYPQTNRSIYDVLGRVYRIGLRFTL